MLSRQEMDPVYSVQVGFGGGKEHWVTWVVLVDRVIGAEGEAHPMLL